jgi:hypothetical protein
MDTGCLRPFAGSPPTQRFEHRIPDPVGIRVLHPGIDDHVVLPASNEESSLLRTLTNGESGWLNRI